MCVNGWQRVVHQVRLFITTPQNEIVRNSFVSKCFVGSKKLQENLLFFVVVVMDSLHPVDVRFSVMRSWAFCTRYTHFTSLASWYRLHNIFFSFQNFDFFGFCASCGANNFEKNEFYWNVREDQFWHLIGSGVVAFNLYETSARLRKVSKK